MERLLPPFIQEAYIDVSLPIKLPNLETSFNVADFGETLVFRDRITYQFISAVQKQDDMTEVTLVYMAASPIAADARVFRVYGRSPQERAIDLCGKLREDHGLECEISTRYRTNPAP